MLTSSNQYLRPEYLTPLPTTLDAKKSPLALLAQTCSAIGADTPNPKLLASIEKSTKSSSASKTPTSLSNHSTTPTNMSESNNNTITSKPSHSPVNASIRSSPLNSTTTSVSPKMPSSFKPYENTPVKSPTLAQNTPESNLRARTPKRTHTPLRSSSSNSSANSPLPDRTSPIQSSPKTPILPPSSSYMLGLPPPLGLDHLKAAYLNYARGLKPDTFNPACRDPYCTGTCISPLFGAASVPKTCPAGCLQCDHAKTPYAPSAHQQQAMAFAHAQLYALAAAANQPYVCNWISAGDASTYCGKRFSNSEELLQHLRAHTGGSGADLLGPSAAHHLLARSGYPTPPLSPLTLGSGRYHPYSKPMLPHSLPPPMVPPHLLPPAVGGLPPYFSPYGSFVPPLPNLAALAQPPAGSGRQSGAQNGLHH
ncbi:zinc finger protein 503-like [Ctenocephalides felis]|uniref:zinc finger protein 503-like n=1 Tax=Ctenocephalides felis TaxID=7515 RepID=UPI000E6E5009|nr:zinc finger protein 503-like [Ctenocephalides felis]